MKRTEIDIQRQYHAKTAGQYDEWHLPSDDEHFFALAFLIGVIDYLHIVTVLDIGSGTGRAIGYIKQRRPDIKIVGIEPVRELRDVGYRKGLSENELLDGDATAVAFSNGEFGLACEFGTLHHIRDHHRVVTEMLRVSKKAVFLSDSNNFGRGSKPSRALKQILDRIGLWKVAYRLRTRGKGYSLSEGDGLAYSYSVFSDYKLIREHCKSIHILNTRGSGVNPYRNASHVACLGIK